MYGKQVRSYFSLWNISVKHPLHWSAIAHNLFRLRKKELLPARDLQIFASVMAAGFSLSLLYTYERVELINTCNLPSDNFTFVRLRTPPKQCPSSWPCSRWWVFKSWYKQRPMMPLSSSKVKVKSTFDIYLIISRHLVCVIGVLLWNAIWLCYCFHIIQEILQFPSYKWYNFFRRFNFLYCSV